MTEPRVDVARIIDANGLARFTYLLIILSWLLLSLMAWIQTW